MILSKELYCHIYKNIISNFKDPKECDAICKLILNTIFNLSNIDISLNKTITNYDYNKIQNIIDRLNIHEPIQYILGICDFIDIELFVNKNVLIPRQETQEMVYDVCNNNYFNNKTVLDICCGSGCICIYIKKHFPKSQVFAVDISEEALNVARKNAEKNNVEITFKKCDIFSDEILKFKDIDTIISNPPYVCESEKKYIKKNVLNYEPAIALFVKDDNPLIFYKRICEIIPTILKKGGSVYCEINEKYGNKTVEIFKNLHFKKKYIKKDINKKNRFIHLLNYE